MKTQHKQDKNDKPILLKDKKVYYVLYANQTKCKEFNNKLFADRFIADILKQEVKQ